MTDAARDDYATRREVDAALREVVDGLRREFDAAIRELRDDLHTVAKLAAPADGSTRSDRG